MIKTNKLKGLAIVLALCLTTGAGKHMAWTYVITNSYSGDPYTTAWKYANAWEIWTYFINAGATEQAAAGILGNMTYEGTLNPGQVEIGHSISDPASGRGLIGWTPGTKIINYANSQGADWYDGDIQCQFIDQVPSQNFLPNAAAGYNYSWAQFKQITNIADAALAFLFEAERPADQGSAQRQRRINAAQIWYNEFSGQVTPPPVPPDPPDPGPTPDPDPTPQPPGTMDMKLIGGRDVMRRIWFKK